MNERFRPDFDRFRPNMCRFFVPESRFETGGRGFASSRFFGDESRNYSSFARPISVEKTSPGRTYARQSSASPAQSVPSRHERLIGGLPRRKEALVKLLGKGFSGNEMEAYEIAIWAAFCHLSGALGLFFSWANVILPAIFWWKRREYEFIDHHGREAVNFQLTVRLLLVFVGLALPRQMRTPVIAAIATLSFVLAVSLAYQAACRRLARYPFALRVLSSGR